MTNRRARIDVALSFRVFRIFRGSTSGLHPSAFLAAPKSDEGGPVHHSLDDGGWLLFSICLNSLATYDARQTVKTLALLLLTLPSLAGAAWAGTINFDDATAGQALTGWTATKTGSGEPKWTIEKDDTAPSKPNVLKQSGEATYPVCLKNDTGIKDGFVEVKFKPVSGKEDQAGGVIWRAKDGDNYYLVRANALEQRHHLPHHPWPARGTPCGSNSRGTISRCSSMAKR
jgi:hypothetical protein